ncbi:MAG TPA: 5'-nucleotidase C-terminal domain-containing protein [Acidimicrobiia bacterium]|nr:5'-nucleotidase C-terminal domain-containing protein [Acidimicrobiia bacterium]
MSTRRSVLMIVAVVIAMIVPMGAVAQPAGDDVEITLLHTNDFHGRLEPDSSGRGGSANLAGVINSIRAEAGAESVALLDAGDVYFAAPAISQLLMGESTIDVYNLMGYHVATFGNHEFDKGQGELAARVAQSDFPWLGANVVLEGTDWDLPTWAQPYEILEVGGIRLGVLGLAGEETPEVTLLGTTAGLIFKDLTDTILYYYDEIMAQADALVVVAHMGTSDSGPYKGLVTVANELITAGKPVDLMIGGHQHQALFAPVYVGDTAIVSAGYYGRYLGRIDVSIDRFSKELSIADYELIAITSPSVKTAVLQVDLQAFFDDGSITNKGTFTSLMSKLDGVMKALERGRYKTAENKLATFVGQVEAQSGKKIATVAAEALLEDVEWILFTMPDQEVADLVAYWADIVAPIVNEPVAATTIPLTRDYNNESAMGDIVTDSMLWTADGYDDGEVNGSVDVALTNAGGLRADIPEGPAPMPYTITWGDTFNTLPFGNTLYLMNITGAQIQDLLDQSATLYKGILQTSGANYYWYNDTGTDSPTAWGAYGITIDGEPLVRDQVYRVVTNDFLAGGQDGFVTFAQGTDRWNTYYDMQQGLVEYLEMLGTVDAVDVPMGRIIRLDEVVTLLHTNDTHGRWAADSFGGGFVYLASLIAEERAHNPNAVLLDAGDTFQGNSFAYFFKDRADNPIAGGMNLLGYDAMTLGNHEFNFGPATFATMLGQVEFPILGTVNLDDDGDYGFINDNVDDYVVLDVDGVEVAIFGLTNPRVYRYELPTNIPGLTFYPTDQDDLEAVDLPALVAAIELADNPDVLVGLTHIGYSPYGDEIDSDLRIAQQVSGIDVLIGGHSHTRLNPSEMVADPMNNPDGTLIAQAQRYASWLGQVNVGFIGSEVVLREGYLIPTSEATPDPALSAYLAPFLAEIDAYNATVIGETMVPIDALQAFTQETNGANLQADAAVFELTGNSISVDLHLSGAMTNAAVATEGPYPLEITKGDMFNLMPYENSLVVFSMNGPQIKTVLERGYRNYWYYQYQPDYGGYSHYTTCMLTTDAGNRITYNDPGAGTPPSGNNVLSMTVDGVAIDFADATTYYTVSTVNYIAAGSCNFNDAGETIWPLDQITSDTQLYVRDSVIDYVDAQVGPISPAIEGRLVFTTP